MIKPRRTTNFQLFNNILRKVTWLGPTFFENKCNEIKNAKLVIPLWEAYICLYEVYVSFYLRIRLLFYLNAIINFPIEKFKNFNLASIYLFKVSNGNTRGICEICSKINNRIFLVSLLLTLNKMFWCFYCWLWARKVRLGSKKQRISYTNVGINLFHPNVPFLHPKKKLEN